MCKEGLFFDNKEEHEAWARRSGAGDMGLGRERQAERQSDRVGQKMASRVAPWRQPFTYGDPMD